LNSIQARADLDDANVLRFWVGEGVGDSGLVEVCAAQIGRHRHFRQTWLGERARISSTSPGQLAIMPTEQTQMQCEIVLDPTLCCKSTTAFLN
jgi:hypothetical protein